MGKDYRTSRDIPAFPTQWVDGLLRDLPGERALLSPSLYESHPAKLDASVAAPEPHDFAVRPGVFVHAKDRADTKASIASRAQRFVTIAKRPSCGRGTGGMNH